MSDPTYSKFNLASHYLSISRPDKVLEVLGEMGSDELSTEQYWYLRSSAHYDLDDNERAREAAIRGLSRFPESDTLLWLLGNADRELGLFAEAERAFLTSLRLDPENTEVLRSYAYLVALAGQEKKAAKLIERAITIEPEDDETIVAHMHQLYLYSRNETAAAKQIIKISNRLLRNDPDNVGAMIMKVIAYQNLGRIGKARKLAEAVVRNSPGSRSLFSFALSARSTTHPLLWPLGIVNRFSPFSIWFAAIAIYFVLRSVFPKAAVVFAFSYLGFCIYSWTVPRLVEKWYER